MGHAAGQLAESIKFACMDEALFKFAPVCHIQNRTGPLLCRTARLKPGPLIEQMPLPAVRTNETVFNCHRIIG